ncbi:ATP-binding cassette domain-containing protein [Alteromonas sp. P256]|uniref:ATP-binding cassette domain-containing protein n=1 Tax=Alteromonas sp. P256 TaxID=3117399 RepID=UPI002FE03AD9
MAHGTHSHIIGLGFALLFAWLLQGVFNHKSIDTKTNTLAKLERVLTAVFANRQHALVRQQTVFYWQSVWQKQLHDVTDWAVEYSVQQAIAVIVPLLALAVIFVVNPVIGAGLLVTLPVVPLFMIIVGKGAAALHQKHFIALSRLGSMFTDRLAALPMLSTFEAHEKQTDLLKEASDTLNSRTMKVVSVAFLSNSVLDFFATLSVALVAVFIGFTLLNELNVGPEITLQQGLWILLVVPLLLSEMKRLGQIYHQKAQAESAMEALKPILASCLCDIETKGVAVDATQTTSVHGESANRFFAEEFAVFDEIADAGQGKSAIVSAQTLTLNKGDCILLSGRSGSGKTLLLEALAGQRRATHRCQWPSIWLTQHPVILPSSVRDNLCLYDRYTDQQLLAMLEKVELSNWLKQLPFGLDTLMTDYPLLSGGEAQRLSIARALLRDRPLWLLDEPTAHLPDEQHHRIAQLIYRLTQDKTVIWASHKALPANWFSGFWHIEHQQVIDKIPLSHAEKKEP